MKSKSIIMPILKNSAVCKAAVVFSFTADLFFMQLQERGKSRNVV